MPARFLAICVLAISIGCGKQPASSPTPAAATSDTNAPAAADAAQMAAVLSELTQAVRRFGAEQRRVPKDLEELAANGYLSRVPPAPAGKKFAISKDLQVYLTNQ
jgi:hypothetical protein